MAAPRQYTLPADAAEMSRRKRDFERRRRIFAEGRERLVAQKEIRRREVRAMAQVRLDALDLIGALALVPEGGA